MTKIDGGAAGGPWSRGEDARRQYGGGASPGTEPRPRGRTDGAAAGAILRPPAARAMLSTVRLVNAVFYAHHGVMEEEHRVGGRFEVDVAMDLDVRAAAENDDLSATVDYERVYAIAHDVVTGSPAYLIERLAWRIAEAVGDAYPTVACVEVTVRKPNPPVGGPCDRAEVTVRRAAS